MSNNEQFPLALSCGTVLAGQYMIDGVLGQGGFGITYKATDYKTKKNVAIKEFFPDTLAYRDTTTVVSYPGERSENYRYGKESFLQEAKTLAEFIGCDNIVRIHSYFEENGTAYFVMDYVEGTSFDKYIKENGGKISYDDAERILVPVMEALAVVHGKGIIHRDVTPDNIFITNEGVVKLLDFGAARYSLGDKSRSLDVILKHGFAPKEQYIRRGKQGPFTDVYSLGATFYYALTGKRPPDSVERMDDADLIPPSSLGVKITEVQENAIFKALEVQSGERFQNMMEFKKALTNEIPTSEIPTNMNEPVINQEVYTASQEQVQSLPRKKSKKPLIISIVSVIVLVTIIATVIGVTSLKKATNSADETTEPVKGGATIVGNSVGNIRNGGFVLDDDSAYIGNNGNSIYYDNEMIFEDEGQYSNLIKYDGYLYFIYEKSVYRYDTTTGKHTVISSLSKYSSDDMEFYLSNDYYFIYSNGTLYRVSIETGVEEEYMNVWKKAFTFCGENLYYIAENETSENSSELFMISSTDFDKVYQSWYTQDGWKYNILTSDGEDIYVTCVKWTESAYETTIIKYAGDLTEIIEEYVLTDECRELAGNMHWISSFNVVDDQMVIALNGEYDWTTFGIQHLYLTSASPTWTPLMEYGYDSENVVISKVPKGYRICYMLDGVPSYQSFDLNGNIQLVK